MQALCVVMYRICAECAALFFKSTARTLLIGVDSIVLHVCPYTFIRYSAYCMQFPGNVARDELRVKCIENNTHSPDFNFDKFLILNGLRGDASKELLRSVTICI